MPKDQKSLTYSSYANMVQRCDNPKASHYSRYGGRGISVCPRWSGPKGFFYFCIDMGLRPQGTSIDRIDPNGDYTPENCRWATPQEQSRNRINTPQVILDGKQMSVIEASEQLDIKISTVRSRIHRGKSLMEALTDPFPSAGNTANTTSRKRKSFKVRINGIPYSIKEACDILLIRPSTVYTRIKEGYPIIQALTDPVTSDDPTIRNRLIESMSIEEYP